jgi:hypothetical protein
MLKKCLDGSIKILKMWYHSFGPMTFIRMVSTRNEINLMNAQKVVHWFTKKSKLRSQSSGPATIIPVTSTRNEKCLITARKVALWYTQKIIVVISQFSCCNINPSDIYKRNEKCLTGAQIVAQWFTQKIIAVTLQFWSHDIQKNDISKEWNKSNECSKSGTLVHTKKS